MYHVASLWKESFQRVCKKKGKIMMKEVKVLKRYLENRPYRYKPFVHICHRRSLR